MEATPRILVVDDDASVRNVLTSVLTEEGYPVRAADGAEAALAMFAGGAVQLVISDLKMPVRDGLWLLGELQHHHPDVAVIMLTGFGDTESAVECLRRGAMDYLLKPPRITELVRAIERALARRRLKIAQGRYQRQLEERVRERAAQLSQTLSAALDALVAALDAREHETSDHSQRVARLTLALGERLGLDGNELSDVARGALLHDIGKIGVPDAILLKPGPLTPIEWQEMKKHPDIGHQILRGIPGLEAVAQIVLAHQEHWDGTGYPRGLQGEGIVLGARLFSIADTLDAIVSDRPYRKGDSFAHARAEILRCSGTQFDPEAVHAFETFEDRELAALVGKSL